MVGIIHGRSALNFRRGAPVCVDLVVLEVADRVRRADRAVRTGDSLNDLRVLAAGSGLDGAVQLERPARTATGSTT